MTSDRAIRDQSYTYFLQEAPELLQVLEQELLNLREDCNITKVHTLMRATHTLKGAAASMGLESIQSVAHSLEDIFKALCQPDVAIDPETEALLFEGYECLRTPLMAELTGTEADHEDVFDRAAAVFIRLQEKLGDCFGQEAYIPTSTELGFDMTQSIFEVGVSQRLERIAEVLANGQPETVAATLQAEAEVFLGLAQSLDLPGFGAIAEATMTALANYPEQALSIAEAALADFQQGQAAVLAGDRTCGGQPTDVLLQLAASEDEGEQGDEGDKEDSDFQLACGTLREQTNDFRRDKEVNFSSEEDKAGDLLLETIWNIPEIEEEEELNSIPKKDPVSPSQTVRINVEHLDRLNYIVGELLTNQNRQSLQDEKLQGEIEALLSQFAQHQQMLDQLGDWSEQMLMLSEKQQTVTHDYRELHALVQSLKKNTEQLETATEDIDHVSRQSSQILEKQRLLFTSALNDLLEARMVPLGKIFNRLPRLLQQLETLHHKQVELKLSGTEILLDKAVAEKLYDPLLHLVRNAFDHGIEPNQVRRQLGKAQTGEIEISAFYQGSHLMIEVRDDGQGINFERIRQQAVEQNLISPEQAYNLNEAELMDLLFEPGFSTTEEVNNLSGRGFGLDVVRAQLEMLQGAVTVSSQQGRGTSFLLQIPFSLTMAKLLLTQAGSVVYAFLTDAIEQILIPQSEQIRRWEGGKTLKLGKGADERLIPICNLAQILHYGSALTTPLTSQTAATEPMLPVLLMRCQDKLLAMEVNQIIGEQESVIRPLEPMIVPPRYVYGGSILADGKLTLVIDGEALACYVFNQYSSAHSNEVLVSFTPSLVSASVQNPQQRVHSLAAAKVLLVEDSLTQRQTLALTLQKSGYQVLQAGDGYEAIEQLQLYQDIGLIICDLEMPQMNGFEFLNYRRQDPSIAQIPVIILTSCTGEQQRLIATELGATAYINKPCVEQQLLATVAEVIST